MIDFVTLSFGLCAVFLDHYGNTAAGIGVVRNQMCEPLAAWHSTGGKRQSLNGHAVGVDAMDDGFMIYVDDQRFIVRKQEGV